MKTCPAIDNKKPIDGASGKGNHFDPGSFARCSREKYAAGIEHAAPMLGRFGDADGAQA